MKQLLFPALLMACSSAALAQTKFAQLDAELPTPNEYRNAAGGPGHSYYQQKADYKMSITLDDDKQIVHGEEVITYTNNSPDVLEYLWLQLDQNIYKPDAESNFIEVEKMEDFKSIRDVENKLFVFEGGYNIESVSSVNGEKMKYAINHTMMRIDPAKPLGPKQSISFKVKWWYNINDRMKVGGRSGYEHFEKDGNYLYTIAQFFPRMCVYSDVEGWQNKQYLGRGEFALPFGDYEVSITVPGDHIVGATGELQNGASVMTAEQRERMKKALTSDTPVLIVTQAEAEENEKDREKSLKTWTFKAKNVRDFAFATSRKFMWDAQNQKVGDKNVLCMSFYPKEGNPLWERYSTKLVAHTIKTYSKYTVDYPYPVAISVHTDKIGMEYPMICFNGGRPQADGTYSEDTKYGMWGVIIHEVGHNFFPMIINSDERQWTWMDEGLNTFVQYLTEQEWERGYPSRRGPAYMITDYMRGDKRFITPIMTNSESIYQFGNNAYGKPATALNILRETVMGRELFDYSFKMYCERWKFKHPTPADLFRTMEDASGVDLDWFWRGWFYSTDYVDVSLDYVKYFQLNTNNPETEKGLQQQQDAAKPEFIGDTRNKESIKETVNERDPNIDDFYGKRDIYAVDKLDKKEYEDFHAKLTPEQKKLLESKKHFYELSFTDKGGLVTPLIIQATFDDGTTEVIRIPAEIWKMDQTTVTKVFIFDKEVKSFQLDPFLESADCDVNNNSYPPTQQPTRYQLFEQKKVTENPMQRQKRLEGQ
ncbi:MAG: aminopeptidase [Candidatus Fluviicola riflensis]|nr:MAG: aminopeptidase [Candidatus Fluviicola riflensis]OGS79516.1 MAG: aminopeptidase [Candidatus Fluviicola riflensis]OGS86947.1 MAG: aminopeptidase [Fluviicola sp. RIFCSPHIGHO2_01_FULL_43_53]OGS89738.1 MAG: aminopeptidase [Fluviicola sp. RIFCSPHIGHO2_12_FULL_43_24]